MWRGDDRYGTGQYGLQYSTRGSLDPGLPQNAPVVPPAMLVGPDNTIVQPYTPLGIRFDVPLGESTVRFTPFEHGILYVTGVRSLNAPGEVEVVRLTIGNGADVARNSTPFDAAAYATQKCFCPVDWGCATAFTFTVRGLQPGARLNWVVFGTYQQSFNSCYPSLGTIEEHAAAVWGLVNGKDPWDPKNVEKWRTSPAVSSQELLEAALARGAPGVEQLRGTLDRWGERRKNHDAKPRTRIGRDLSERLRRHLEDARDGRHEVLRHLRGWAAHGHFRERDHLSRDRTRPTHR